MEKKKQFLMKQKEHLNRGKRGILSVIFGRTGILLMLILLQIGLLLVGFRFLSNYIFAIYGGSIFLGFVLSVYLINRSDSDGSGIRSIVLSVFSSADGEPSSESEGSKRSGQNSQSFGAERRRPGCAGSRISSDGEYGFVSA